MQREPSLSIWCPEEEAMDVYVDLQRLREAAAQNLALRRRLAAAAREKQKLLEEAALSEGALRKQETEALCERFIAAES